MAYSIPQVYALVNCVLYSVEQYHIRSWEQWFRSLDCSQLLTGTIHIKYSLMINVIGCWNMHTVIVNMFILTVWEGTSLAILLIPVSVNVPSAKWHLVLWGDPAGDWV